MPVENQKNIGEIIAQLMDTENVSIEKLASLTNIPSRFIIAIREGELNKLPAEPYVRGYLIKIAAILHTEPEPLISAYKNSAEEYKKSGKKDILPENKFANAPIKKGWLFAGLVLLVVLGTIGFRLNDVLGIPSLNLTIPETSTESSVTISGDIRPNDQLTLNGEIVYTDKTGRFQEEIFLIPGINTLNFKVKRYLGREIEVTKQIYYQPAGNPQLIPNYEQKTGTPGF